MRALPLADCTNEGGHNFRYFGLSVLRAPAEQTKVATVFGNFGPSGVRALPLAAGINEGGHYFRY